MCLEDVMEHVDSVVTGEAEGIYVFKFLVELVLEKAQVCL
jgi:hypothetical protein